MPNAAADGTPRPPRPRRAFPAAAALALLALFLAVPGLGPPIPAPALAGMLLAASGALAAASSVLSLRAYLHGGDARAAVVAGGLLAYAALVLVASVLGPGEDGSAERLHVGAGAAAFALLVLAAPQSAHTLQAAARRRIGVLVVAGAAAVALVAAAASTVPADANGDADSAVAGAAAAAAPWVALALLAAALARGRAAADALDARDPLRALRPTLALAAAQVLLLAASPAWTPAWWVAHLAGAFWALWSLDVAVGFTTSAEASERALTADGVRTERLSALGTLVAGVAHEINNPLLYVRGNIELALADVRSIADARARREEPRGVDLDAAAEGLQTALEGTDRIARITKALKTVSRRGTAEREAVDLNEVAQGVASLLRVGTPERVKVRLELSPVPAPVLANASELHQAALNLVRNSIDALDGARGEVVIRTAHHDQVAELGVLDDGPGIPPDVRERLFTPFFTTKPQGTGLGLSIVHTIVKHHGGDVLLESREGHGTSVLLRFPAAGPTDVRERLEGVL